MIKISIIKTLLLGALMLSFTGCINVPKTVLFGEDKITVQQLKSLWSRFCNSKICAKT